MRIALLAVLLGLLVSGCGGVVGGDRPDEEATVLLDFAPNGVHAGIYLATERDFDEAEGVELEIRRPGASTDALRQLQTGRADMAILDIHDLGLARERGRDVVGVYAVVQRPLAAVIARPGIDRPRDLEGRRAGVTGLPSDDAVLRSVVAGDRGDPDRVRSTTIGFNAVRALLSGRVDAATAFWNAEGVALERRRPGFKQFRVDEFGAPAYPELVLCVTRTTLEDRAPLVRATVRALQRGYAQAQVEPDSAVTALLTERAGDRAELAAQLDAVSASFTAGARAPGELREEVLREWAEWARRFGILSKPLDVSQAFDFDQVGPIRNP